MADDIDSDKERSRSNIFQFPDLKPQSAGQTEPLWRPGQFLDEHGASIVKAMNDLNDDTLAVMYFDLKQHRSIATMLIEMMEAELQRRRGA